MCKFCRWYRACRGFGNGLGGGGFAGGCEGSLVLTRLIVGIWWVSWVDNYWFFSREGEGGVRVVIGGGGLLLLGRGCARGEGLWLLEFFVVLSGILGFAFGVLLDGVCGGVERAVGYFAYGDWECVRRGFEWRGVLAFFLFAA